MRIEAGEHAVDRAADQGLVVDLLDIFGADPLEHAHELVELAIGVDVDRGEGGGGGGNERDRADEGEGAEEIAWPLGILLSAFETRLPPF